MGDTNYQNIVLLSDFDGTIAAPDILKLLFTNFAQGNWEEINLDYLSGRLTLEECLKLQYAMIHASKEEMLQWIHPRLHSRAHFEQLLQYCSENHILFLIVSSGLDFMIEDFFNKFTLKSIPFIATQTEFTTDNMEISFVSKKNDTSIDFKEDNVCYYQNLGKKVYYIGDGISDISAVKHADFSFVVKDSRLVSICQENHIKYAEFQDFNEVINYLKRETLQNKGI